MYLDTLERKIMFITKQVKKKISMSKNKDKLVIFDTTLRDGEQSPGASMNVSEKLRIAKVLEKLNVDVIEAGFPIASRGDFDAVFNISSNIKNSTICALARAIEKDIDTAGEAIKPAKSSRIHTFIATSEIHMQKKLGMSKKEVIDQAVKSIKRIKKYTNNIEFSPEDAGRSEFDFLSEIIEKAINAGANTINIPDTVGYNIPEQFGNLIKKLIYNIPNSDKAIFSVHCHNDLGLAVANSLSAVMNGARQVECTINGLGERAGNASLEEVVMTVKTRQDIFNCDTQINTGHIVPASKLVSSITGFPVQPNKAIVGANAFAHESGIHQDGVLKHRETYEIMKAQDVGWQENKLVLGKHSGRNALKTRLSEIGYEIKDTSELNILFKKFKDLADIKHEIYDDDLHSLISNASGKEDSQDYNLVSIKSISDSSSEPYSEITLEKNMERFNSDSKGGGPVDAAFKAIEKIVNSNSVLQLYSVNNITDGTDSLGEVTVRMEKQGIIVNGIGSDTDIVIASAKAYLDAINKLNNKANIVHPQLDHV
jgi:2-isopropylmalate synthase